MKLLFSLFLLTTLWACEVPTAFERTNPLDHKSSAFIPSAPDSVRATLVGPFAVRVQWHEANFEEEGFLVERSVDGGVFETVGQVGPNVLELRETVRRLGRYVYRVSALSQGRSSPAIPAAVLDVTPLQPGLSLEGFDLSALRIVQLGANKALLYDAERSVLFDAAAMSWSSPIPTGFQGRVESHHLIAGKTVVVATVVAKQTLNLYVFDLSARRWSLGTSYLTGMDVQEVGAVAMAEMATGDLLVATNNEVKRPTWHGTLVKAYVFNTSASTLSTVADSVKHGGHVGKLTLARLDDGFLVVHPGDYYGAYAGADARQWRSTITPQLPAQTLNDQISPGTAYFVAKDGLLWKAMRVSGTEIVWQTVDLREQAFSYGGVHTRLPDGRVLLVSTADTGMQVLQQWVLDPMQETRSSTRVISSPGFLGPYAIAAFENGIELIIGKAKEWETNVLFYYPDGPPQH